MREEELGCSLDPGRAFVKHVELTFEPRFNLCDHFIFTGEDQTWLEIRIPMRPNGRKGWVKESALGPLWAILQPLFTMLIFSIFFGQLAGMPSDGVPYPLFAYVALVPWTFFANGLTLSSNSLVANQGLLRKVFFPRLVIPLSAVASGIIDFLIAFVVLIGLVAWYGIAPTANVVWLPALVLLALVTALGAGLWLSALNVLYRDVRYANAAMGSAGAQRRLAEPAAPGMHPERESKPGTEPA